MGLATSYPYSKYQLVDEIESWLINYLADLVEIDPNKIDKRIHFEFYGMDSSRLLVLSGDIQDWIVDKFSPFLSIDCLYFFDYRNIEASSEHLAELIFLENKDNSIQKIKALAIEVLGDSQIADNWLNQPNPALGGKIPIDLLNTPEGQEEVYELLMRIEYGVYS